MHEEQSDLPQLHAIRSDQIREYPPRLLRNMPKFLDEAYRPPFLF